VISKAELQRKHLEEQQRKQEEARAAVEEAKRLQEEEESRIKEERLQVSYYVIPTGNLWSTSSPICLSVNLQAKLLKDKAKKARSRARSDLRALCNCARRRQSGASIPHDELMITEEETEFMCENMDTDELLAAVSALGAKEESLDLSGVGTLRALLAQTKAHVEEKKREEEAARAALLERHQQQQQQKVAAVKERPWSADELSMLAKAVVKFPAGTQKRWQQIADFINHQLSLSDLRTKEECIKEYQQVHLTMNISSFYYHESDGSCFVIFQVQAAPQKAVETKGSGVTVLAGGSKGFEGSELLPGGGAASASSKVMKIEAKGEDDVWTQEQQRQLGSRSWIHRG